MISRRLLLRHFEASGAYELLAKCGDLARADDIRQELLLRMIQLFDRGGLPEPMIELHKYMRRSARNALSTWKRDYGRRARLLERSGVAKKQPERPARDDDGHEAEIRRLLCELPPNRRIAIEMHFLDGLTDIEIEKSTGRKARQVKLDRHRGLEQIRRKLRDCQN